MATKHQITLRFKDEYAKASKKQKGVILDRMCETLNIGRSTARRRLREASSGGVAEPRRPEGPRRYSDRSRELLREVWLLMDMCLSSNRGGRVRRLIWTLGGGAVLLGFGCPCSLIMP